MDLNGGEGLFDDDEDEQNFENGSDVAASREYVAYLIDASPAMFLDFNEKDSYFGAVMKCLEENLKSRIIARDDKVGICFFNTREKKNIQDTEGVYVWSELVDPSAELIRNFASLPENFEKEIGTNNTAVKEDPLFDALWVVQAMLRSGTTKNVDKRILLFTNNDDPFGEADVAVKADMRRTTIQRAKDAQDLGIAIDLIPLSRHGEEFNMAIFYESIVQSEDEDDGTTFLTAAAHKFQDLKDKLRKKLFKKRVVRRMTLTVTSGTDIGIKTYALVRPAAAVSHTWVDSRTNTPLKSERSYICSDTGALMTEPLKRFEEYQGKKVVFTTDEVMQIKNVTNVQLQLLGFKPLGCLQQYHNLRPPTFLYPDEEAVRGSTSAFIALHRAMLRVHKYAVALYGTRASSQMVALVAQEEEVDEEGFQTQPPGMHMIYLPYADDIRGAEKFNLSSEARATIASKEQVDRALAVIRKIEIKNFSVFDIPNPALQRHYAILQGVALGEDEELPEVEDCTLPDAKGIARATEAVQAFKDAVYGPEHDQEKADAAAAHARGSVASQKRKAAADVAAKEAKEYNWVELADTGKLKEHTVQELKYYLTANKLPLTGKKEVLIDRILSHLGK